MKRGGEAVWREGEERYGLKWVRKGGKEWAEEIEDAV